MPSDIIKKAAANVKHYYKPVRTDVSTFFLFLFFFLISTEIPFYNPLFEMTEGELNGYQGKEKKNQS